MPLFFNIRKEDPLWKKCPPLVQQFIVFFITYNLITPIFSPLLLDCLLVIFNDVSKIHLFRVRNLESLLRLSNQELLDAYNKAIKLKLSLEFINILKDELIKRRIPF